MLLNRQHTISGHRVTAVCERHPRTLGRAAWVYPYALLVLGAAALLQHCPTAVAQTTTSVAEAPLLPAPTPQLSGEASSREVTALLQRANLSIEKNQYDDALQSLRKAYQISRTLEDKTLDRNVLNSMANVYYNTGQLQPAHRYYSELVALDEADNNKLALSVSLFNLAHVNASQQQFQLADTNFQRSLALSRDLGDVSGAAYTLKALGVTQQAQHKLAAAQTYLNLAMQGFEQTGNTTQIAILHRHMGDIDQDQGNFETAVAHYETALPVLAQVAANMALQRTYRGLSTALAQLQDYENALLTYRAYAQLAQQDQQQKILQATQRLQVEFETQRFSDDNERLALQNRQQELELEQRNELLKLQFLVLALAAGIIVLMAALWWRSRNHAKEMREQATTDELTGLFNRRAISQYGHKEWQRSVRFKRPLACLMLDIDHFKSINDTWGHAVGDQVLKTLARVMENSLRKTDTLGRFGGEEFLLLATETETAQAEFLAERIRQNIAATRFESMPDRTVTVSIGIAQMNRENSLDVLIQHADQALYTAKNAGRNRSSVYPETAP